MKIKYKATAKSEIVTRTAVARTKEKAKALLIAKGFSPSKIEVEAVKIPEVEVYQTKAFWCISYQGAEIRKDKSNLSFEQALRLVKKWREDDLNYEGYE